MAGGPVIEAEALAVADNAAAEAGSGPVDTVSAGCGLIRFGVFFDGTGNSRDHVGQAGFDSWHTNIDLLERIYETTSDGPVETTVSGQTRQTLQMKIYKRGIGVDRYGQGTNNYYDPPDRTIMDASLIPGARGYGWGTGPEGVESRVDEAVEDASRIIQQAAGDVQPCDIHFDVFGFSRGAAAARYFANRVKSGAISYSSATTKTKILGLFDTVSSLGRQSGGNMGGHGNVDITTDGVAERIIHIIAMDEIRYHFPLTRARNSIEVTMIGAHSDIGGGYRPDEPANTFSFLPMHYPGVRGYFEERWGVTMKDLRDQEIDLSGRFWLAGIPGGYMFGADELNSQVHIHSDPIHGLQFVSLKLMHHHAISSGAPFRADLGTNIQGINIQLPADLSSYCSALMESPRRIYPSTETDLRRKYVHVSFNTNTDHMMQGNLPEEYAKRRSDLM